MNLRLLSKDKLVWMASHRCKHRHLYVEHLSCYRKDTEEEIERIGFLDIEASGLDADFGIVLSYCIKPYGQPSLKRLIAPSELASKDLDKRLLIDCIADMRKFDRLVTYYGTGFDIPFIRTRAMLHGLDFPLYREIKHTDVYYWVRNKMKLHRRRMEVVCDFLGIPAKGHPMIPPIWTAALTGNKKALNYILVHNLEDVDSLEEVYKRLLDFTANRAVTI